MLVNPNMLSLERLAQLAKKNNQDAIKFFETRNISVEFCDHEKPYDFNTGNPIGRLCLDCQQENS